MKSLQDKVAIITGASRGIGAEIAKAIAQAGASVVINYTNNRSATDLVVSEIKSLGGNAISVRADVGDSVEVKALFDTAITHFGKIDILINNAGTAIFKAIQDTSDEELDRIFAINVKGTFYCLREAATRLSNGGRIINISSSVTRLILPTYGAYAATKGAVEQLTRVFAKEVGPRGITVNSISPGPTNTELFLEGKSEETIQRLAAMSAFGRIGETEDIAKVVLFLASEGAAWVTGQNIGANGGIA
ncbi:MAG: SDR family oxidoreductase [Candidatus Competibacter sp.]|jgi:3-oxoacyl-[acyl-carrier protein] reductase|nr:SDR family oxidoreductase [Candidatus Competibacter sp.]